MSGNRERGYRPPTNTSSGDLESALGKRYSNRPEMAGLFKGLKDQYPNIFKYLNKSANSAEEVRFANRLGRALESQNPSEELLRIEEELKNKK